MKKSDIVRNKITLELWVIIEKNNQDGIYCQNDKGSRTWFHKSDMEETEY